MRVRVLSDLHQEFGEVDVPDVDCDCVILAGDIDNKTHGLEWIRARFRDVPVIYICGNHEYYGEKLPRLTERLREDSRGSHIHFLEDTAVTIGGVHFFGSTLWTDMALHGEVLAGSTEAAATMNDYKRIRNSDHHYRHLSPSDTRQLHARSLLAMERFFAAHDPRTSVIVTHHAPSIRSLPERRQTELISCAYASRLDALIERHQPQLWIHGHIHHSNDYRIGSTRILANPRAYPDDPNKNFVPDLVVEVNGERAPSAPER